jgi:hypothetical protein
MEIRCTHCGAALAGPPGPGMPFHCTFCGAPQAMQSPMAAMPPAAANPYGPASPLYGPPPAQFGAPPTPYGQVPGMGGPVPDLGMTAGPPRMNVGLSIAIVGMVLGLFGAVFAIIVARRAASPNPTTTTTAKAGFPVANLAGLSLAQTPDAMAKVTGVQAAVKAGDDTKMEFPISGSPFDRIQIAWDPSDSSHAKEVYMWADVPPSNDAAIKAKIASYVGARASKDGNLYFPGVLFNYGMTRAYASAQMTSGGHANLHWKQQVDAGWDLVRNAVLGLNVPVTDADLRDWLGRGYSLAAIGAIDTTVDVDHSTAMMQAAFPDVATEQAIGLQHTIAVDSPWFGEAELDWENAKNGHLTRVMLRPPPNTNNEFSNQADINACVQALLGSKGQRNEEDHLKGTYDTAWKPAEGGEVRVYGHMVSVAVGGEYASRKMSKAGYQKVMDGLGACAKKK